MEHIDETNKPSLEEMIERAEKALIVANEAQIAYEQSLLDIANTHGATYEHRGQVYQIRMKEESRQGRTIVYLCKLRDWPKTWLSKNKGGAKAKKRIMTILEKPDTDPVDLVTSSTEEEAPAITQNDVAPEQDAIYASTMNNSMPEENTTTVIE